jgi:hypothetical protein
VLWAELFVGLLGLYGGIGILFAIPFAIAGAQQIDAGAKGAGLAFRLLILPGAAAFWPLLLNRWRRGVHS